MNLTRRRALWFIYLYVLQRTDPQCLRQLSPGAQTCSFRYNHESTERAEKDLNQCFDDCLGTSSGEDCKAVEWNPKEGKCLVHTIDVPSTVIGDCVVFSKVYCPEVTDYTCQKPVTNAVYSKMIPIPFVNDIEICGTICKTMGLKCKGYEWVKSTSTCKWATGWLNKHRKPEHGSIIINLNTAECEKRCYLLRNNALTKGGVNRKRTLLDLKGCLDILRNEHKPRLDWDGTDRSCWVHNFLQGEAEYWKHPLHQFQNFCQHKKFKKVCLQKHPGQRMQRGLVLRHVTKEADCVDICSNTRNCVAVDWSVLEVTCYFHHFRVNIVDNSTFNHYVPVSSCSELKNITSVNESPTCQSRNNFVKSLRFEGNVEKTVDWIILPSRICCASHCISSPHCKGFTFVLHTSRCYLGFHGNKFQYIRCN